MSEQSWRNTSFITFKRMHTRASSRMSAPAVESCDQQRGKEFSDLNSDSLGEIRAQGVAPRITSQEDSSECVSIEG
eukprot:2523952-Heterocapsa_arctica.AAC.1